MWSCNFAIARGLFTELRGFDERFPCADMEDVELHYRIKLRGLAPQFIAAAAVLHPWRPRSSRQQLNRHRAATLLYLKLHPEEHTRINSTFYLRLVARQLLRETMPGLIKGDFQGVRAAGREHLAYLRMALLLRRPPAGSAAAGEPSAAQGEMLDEPQPEDHKT